MPQKDCKLPFRLQIAFRVQPVAHGLIPKVHCNCSAKRTNCQKQAKSKENRVNPLSQCDGNFPSENGALHKNNAFEDLL
jgi:hypothetical protein